MMTSFDCVELPESFLTENTKGILAMTATCRSAIRVAQECLGVTSLHEFAFKVHLLPK